MGAGANSPADDGRTLVTSPGNQTGAGSNRTGAGRAIRSDHARAARTSTGTDSSSNAATANAAAKDCAN